jgi:hypothetical protein
LPYPRRRARADIPLPAPAPDDEIYLSGRQAARVVGVTPRAIQLWRKAGWLTEVAQEPGGRRLLMYRLDDVLAADRRARRAA